MRPSIRLRWLNLKLQTKISFIFALLIVLLVSVLTASIYNYNRVTVKNYLRDTMKLNIDSNAKEAAASLQQLQTLSNLVQGRGTTYLDTQKMPEIFDLAVALENGEDTQALRSLFEQIAAIQMSLVTQTAVFASENSGLTCTFFLNEDYKASRYLTGSSALTQTDVFSNSSVLEQDWYRQTVAAHGVLVSVRFQALLRQACCV